MFTFSSALVISWPFMCLKVATFYVCFTLNSSRLLPKFVFYIHFESIGDSVTRCSGKPLPIFPVKIHFNI